MGFFEWIRAGVRRAVLLGFSDAVTEIGTRSEHEDLSPALANALRQGLMLEVDGKAAGLAAPALNAPANNPAGRKRLGKSLEEIRSGATKAA